MAEGAAHVNKGAGLFNAARMGQERESPAPNDTISLPGKLKSLLYLFMKTINCLSLQSANPRAENRRCVRILH